MATYNSDQAAKYLAVPATKLAPDELGGRQRILRWSYTTPTGGVAATSTIELGKLPAGARVISGLIQFGAMGATATAHVGTVADTDRYAASIDVAAAGTSAIANTAALYLYDVTTAETVVIATANVATWVAAKAFNGNMLYVVD